MTEIIKKITDLEPDSTYAFTIRAINRDLNVEVPNLETLLFTTPADPTVPDNILNIEVAANINSIMITYTPLNEKDIIGYEYEVYTGEDIVDPLNPPYTLTTNADILLEGFSNSSVISLTVPDNSTIDEDSNIDLVYYYVRLRGVDTSNNKGEWSSIIRSNSLPLIESVLIKDISASKITSGTIGAETIILNGLNSVIRSNSYDELDPLTSGWIIRGDDYAEFGNVKVRGTIDIGGNDNTSFHVDIDGNMWLGDSTYASAPFRVSSTGSMFADDGTFSGDIVGGTITIGSGGNVFKVDSVGNFWAGSVNFANAPFSVSSDGTVNATLGNFAGNIIGGSINIADTFLVDTDGTVVIDVKKKQMTIGDINIAQGLLPSDIPIISASNPIGLQGGSTRIGPNGYIGINKVYVADAPPSSPLEVNGFSDFTRDADTGVVSAFTNLSTDTTADGIRIEVGASTPATTNEFIQFYADGVKIGAIRGDGAGGVELV